MTRSEVDFQKLKEVEQNISEYDYFATTVCQACIMCGTLSHLYNWVFIAFLKLKARYPFYR